jgi:diguanylate cyclase (GGDEF)-like protein
MAFFKKYPLIVMLILLVFSTLFISYYNYKEQKNLFLKQMQNNSLNITNSISSSLEKFESIKSTINLQKLVDDISFELEIFEFRYLAPDGTIKNSIFKDEIGKALTTKSFIQTQKKNRKLNTFFFEIRDFVNVMSIYYPIYDNNKLIGIIDLCVDVSEYKIKKELKENLAIYQRQFDIDNLLKSINSSILNSLSILKKTNINDFLNDYTISTNNILEISIINENRNIYASSNKDLIGEILNDNYIMLPALTTLNNKLAYRSIINIANSQKKLMLLVNASEYQKNKNQLITTAILTSCITLLFAIFISLIIYYSAIRRSHEEKKRLKRLVHERTKEIEILSNTDNLTGLWNRGYLEERLNTEFKRAKRYHHNMSILIVDFDYFKHVNDTYGHLAGDEVLREISSRIIKSQRETDFVGRFGGEEIVIILPETNLDTSKKIAKKLLTVISKDPVKFENNSISVTVSIGISNLKETHEDYNMLFEEADKALYSAKELGRNRAEVF